MTRRGLFASISAAIVASTINKFKRKEKPGYSRWVIYRNKREWNYYVGVWQLAPSAIVA